MKTEFTVVDMETTGFKHSLHRVWEMAAIRVEVTHEPTTETLAENLFCTLKEFFCVRIVLDSLNHAAPYLVQPIISPSAVLMMGILSPLRKTLERPDTLEAIQLSPDSRFEFVVERYPKIGYPIATTKPPRMLVTTYQLAWMNLFRIVQGTYWVGSNPSFDYSFFQDYLDAVGSEPPKLASHKLIDPTSQSVPLLISGKCKSLSQANVARALELGEEPHTALGDAYQLLQIFCRLNHIRIDFPSYDDLLKELPHT
jgi:DNA polymerase III epsilon subunit-like protein